jgi:hypothetical protein
MTIIEVYPSTLPGEPIERHQAHDATLHDWLLRTCPGYQAGPQQPISATVDGCVVPPQAWPELALQGQTVELRPNPRDIVTGIIVGLSLLLGVGMALMMRPRVSTTGGQQGGQLAAANINANTPRLNQVVPEIAGRYKVFPDYLCQPRRYFVNERTQAVDVMLAIGCGEYQIGAQDIYIGETRLADLGDSANYTIFGPGATVSGHLAHRNFYNAPEVGPSTGSAGLRMSAGVQGTSKATATNYVFDGTSVIIPVGAGAAPQDWEPGNVLSIVAPIRSLEIIDGGGSYFTQYSDKVRSAIGDLALAVGHEIVIVGIPGQFSNKYKITSIADIGSGVYEMTLYQWSRWTNSEGAVVEGWRSATGLPPGAYTNVDIYRPAVIQNILPIIGISFFAGEMATRYRITSVVTGTINDESGNPVTVNVGWNLQRLTPDTGVDDPLWNGFGASKETSSASINLDWTNGVTGGWLGPFRATPADEYASHIEFDIFAPGGLGWMNDGGGIDRRDRQFELQWRADDGAWSVLRYNVSAASRDQLGWTFSIALPTPKRRVDVRIRRLSAEDKDVKALDRIEWYGLRALLPSPSSYSGITTMALTLQGSDVIAARTENQINLIAHRVLEGTPTRSIAPWVRYVGQSIGYGQDDINSTELATLATVWDARGDWFDHVIKDQTTVRDALDAALRAGFADMTIDNGQIRPVRDQPRSVYEHLYTPQNMASALRRQIVAYNPDDYDGVDVEYTSATSWQQEVVQCRLPGDVGVRVQKLKLEGVTDKTRAWRIGMRQRRELAYRRKSYTFQTEWDALNSRYLSFCALSDDVPGYGQSSILLSVETGPSGVLLRTSEPMTLVDGATHVVALRRPDGTLSGPHIAVDAGENSARIDGPLDFVPLTVEDGSEEPTHVLHGTVERWSYPVLVTSITPAGDRVDVTAVGYDARVYADDDNAPA